MRAPMSFSPFFPRLLHVTARMPLTLALALLPSSAKMSSREQKPAWMPSKRAGEAHAAERPAYDEICTHDRSINRLG
jgi:hypothetical protein